VRASCSPIGMREGGPAVMGWEPIKHLTSKR
jgi:hypothetical protein